MIKPLLIFSIISINVFAVDMPLQNRELPAQDMKTQNKHIAKLAAQEMSKSLPHKIDRVTQLINIKANNATLEYIYEINIDSKSDEEIKREDHSTMKRVITRNTCKSSKRFLEADISLSYIYKSFKTKTELFRFNIDQESCFKL